MIASVVLAFHLIPRNRLLLQVSALITISEQFSVSQKSVQRGTIQQSKTEDFTQQNSYHTKMVNCQ